MIYFSPAKINLGLQILEKRADEFHMLRSVMYPTGLCDIIEINQLPGEDIPVRFSQSGIRFEADLKKNLCLKAWNLMAAERNLPPVEIHLHKQTPVGAGLGGGSSNASTVLHNDFNRVGRGITSPPSHTTQHTLVLGGFKLIVKQKLPAKARPRCPSPLT